MVRSRQLIADIVRVECEVSCDSWKVPRRKLMKSMRVSRWAEEAGSTLATPTTMATPSTRSVRSVSSAPWLPDTRCLSVALRWASCSSSLKLQYQEI